MDKKIEKLKQEIREKLPQVYKAAQTKEDFVILHQDAFAADLQEEEFLLLGKFIKFIGLSGKEIHIVGRNDDTIKR